MGRGSKRGVLGPPGEISLQCSALSGDRFLLFPFLWPDFLLRRPSPLLWHLFTLRRGSAGAAWKAILHGNAQKQMCRFVFPADIGIIASWHIRHPRRWSEALLQSQIV